MKSNEQVITIVFVLVIGLLGGYMIGQHVGYAAEDHEAIHESGELMHADDDRDIQSDEISNSETGETKGEVEVGVQ